MVHRNGDHHDIPHEHRVHKLVSDLPPPPLGYPILYHHSITQLTVHPGLVVGSQPTDAFTRNGSRRRSTT